MPHSYHNGFYHFVWATWDRQQCDLMTAKIIALGGLSDPVHLLVTVSTFLCLADFMEKIKGSSSYALNRAYVPPIFSFKCQGGYRYHTVSASHVGTVRRYIERQKDRHTLGNLWPTCQPPIRTPPQPAQAGLISGNSPAVQGFDWGGRGIILWKPN